MQINHLWASWRESYINGNKDNNANTDCIFCQIMESRDDEKNFILHRGKSSIVIMNLYPYNCGHVMIIPYEHTNKLENIPEYTIFEIASLTQKSIRVLNKLLSPQGYNIGYNLGEFAGAGIADHLHQHIVPRWLGDTNFMPVIGGTKVISQNIFETYSKLKSEFEK